MSYIDLELTTDPIELADNAAAYLEAAIPGWTANAGNLETLLIEAIAQMAAEQAEVAQSVPLEIFKYFGEQLVGLAAVAGARAQGATTWVLLDTAGHTIPAGTLVSINDTAYETTSDVVVAPGSSSTAVGGVLIRALDESSDPNGDTGDVELIDTLAFVSAITLAGSISGGADPESTNEYVDRLKAELQLLASRPIVPRDFEILARRVPGVERALAIDNYRKTNNLLTANQSNIETDATPWVNDANATITRSTAQAAQGSASLSMQAIAAGQMVVRTGGGTTGPAVTPGRAYTVRAEFRAATTGRLVWVNLVWYTAAGAFISTANGASVTDTTTGWTEVSVSAIAPSTAAFCAVQLATTSTVVLGEVHYADKIQVREGDGTDWVVGGTPATNVERYITIAAIDEAGNDAGPTARAAIIALIDPLREINFVVDTVDTYTSRITIGVTANVSVLPSYDKTDVVAQVTAALTEYFQPYNWGRLPVEEESQLEQNWVYQDRVGYLNVAEVIKRVEGVAFINSLSLSGGTGNSAGDRLLSHPQSLTAPGTITITAA